MLKTVNYITFVWWFNHKREKLKVWCINPRRIVLKSFFYYSFLLNSVAEIVPANISFSTFPYSEYPVYYILLYFPSAHSEWNHGSMHVWFNAADRNISSICTVWSTLLAHGIELANYTEGTDHIVVWRFSHGLKALIFKFYCIHEQKSATV